MEVVQQLARAPRSVLRLGLPVVPGDAARLPLHVGTGNVGRDPAQQALDRAQPGQVEVDEGPPLLAWRPREVAVLRAEMDREPSEPLLEIPAAPTADDVDVRIRDARERAQQGADLRRRLGEIGMELELAERPVVVEHHRSSLRAAEAPLDLLLESRVDRRWALRVAVRVASSARGA